MAADVSEERHSIQRSDWHRFLDDLTKEHEGESVVIEVLDREFGDQLQAEQLPLAYIEYDHKDDVFIVAVGGRDGRHPVVLRHMIWHPQRILADSSLPGMTWAFDVVDDDDVETIITLHPVDDDTDGDTDDGR